MGVCLCIHGSISEKRISSSGFQNGVKFSDGYFFV